MPDFRMPSLGADMEHGTVIEWLVKPGDFVHRGDILATVDTDKALMDVESFSDGVVAELLVEPGTDCPVGTLLARISETPASTAAPVPAESPPPPPPPPQPEPEPEPVSPPPHLPRVASPPVRHLAHRLGVDLDRVHGTGRHGAITRADVERAVADATAPGPRRVRSSPRARSVAAALGLDLDTVPGTGPQGAVTEADVRRAAAETPSPAPEQTAPTPRSEALEVTAPAVTAPAVTAPAVKAPAERAAAMRRAVGQLMAKSKRTIPHYYVSTTVDLRAAVAWMQSVNAGRPVTERLVPSALLLKASALAARAVPEMNGFYDDATGFTPSASVHLGVAIALRKGGGLVAPAIHDADTLPLDALMERLRDLVSRVRGGTLTRAEMSDSTITVTNLGDLGVESVVGVIYPPQVALVGFGRVVEQPFASDGMLGVRPAVTATLSADHRVSDGLRGGRYLGLITDLLQKPEEL